MARILFWLPNSSTATVSSRQCQRQLAARLGRHDDEVAAGLCARQPGRGDRAVHTSAARWGRSPMPGRLRNPMPKRLPAVALTQLERKGAPSFSETSFLDVAPLRLADLRHAGTGDRQHGRGQLARRLGLPLRCAGNFSNSKRPDAQAMQEGSCRCCRQYIADANFVLHSAGFADGLLAHVLRKIHDGHGFLRGTAFLSCRRRGRRQYASPWTPSWRWSGQPLLAPATRCAIIRPPSWDSALSE